MSLTWNDLFFSGSVFNMSTSLWLARLRTKPADLGIEDTDAVNKALSLGQLRLAPKEAFESINEIVGKARRAVDNYSLAFGFIYGSRFVPAANMPKLSERLRELRTEFEAAVDKFIAEYDEMKESMLPVIEQALRDACKTPEAAEAAIARVRQDYPAADVVRRKFGLHWSVYAIQAPKATGVEAALASEGETVKGVVAEMVVQLREEVTSKLADVIKLIQNGGKLKDVSLNAARAVLDRVDAVNVLGDDQLTKQVAALRSALNSIETGKRIPDATVTGLEAIKTELEGSIEEAVAAAEKKLTQVGKRKLAVA